MITKKGPSASTLLLLIGTLLTRRVSAHFGDDGIDCSSAPETGPCKGSFLRYYYDPESQSCGAFTYGGCRGNGNRYETHDECLSTCYLYMSDMISAEEPDEGPNADCRSRPDQGLCKAYIPRYYYDKRMNACQKFIYGGCGGNGNNYLTQHDCNRECMRKEGLYRGSRG